MKEFVGQVVNELSAMVGMYGLDGDVKLSFHINKEMMKGRESV